MNNREQKIYRKEIWLVLIWAIIILFLSINPLVYWKEILNTTIFGFRGQYGYYLLVMIFLLPAGTFLAAYLGNKVENEIINLGSSDGPDIKPQVMRGRTEQEVP